LPVKSNQEEPKPQKITVVIPDTVFKILTRKELEELRLRLGDTEIQFVGRTDLVIEIPAGVDVTGTLFDFFH
jgi:hypothetical protein